MNIRRKVERRAAELGATVSRERSPDGESVRVLVEAPPGKIWAAVGVHQFIEASDSTWDSAYVVTEPSWARAYGYAFDVMAYGLADCVDPDCDCCEEAGA